MISRLNVLLSKIKADYADLRYEKRQDTKIAVRTEEIVDIGENVTDGYVLRVLKNGGLASIAFTREKDAEKAIEIAVKNAELIGKNLKNPVKFAQSKIIKDTFIPELKEDPRNIPIEEKLKMIKKYDTIPNNYHKIISTSTNYLDLTREKYFVNTEGTEIREDLITTRISGSITAKDGNLTQTVRVKAGGSQGFQHLRNQESNFEERTKTALDLLKAEPISGGTYNVILNPSLTGVFAHEAFGHFSEADIIEKLPSMRKRMQLGKKIGSDVLNIVDDATMPNQLGFYKYDDEGVPVRKVQLIKNGVLSGRLHSRRTAYEFDSSVTGHNIAQDYRFAPIVRMGNIFIEPGRYGFEELLSELGDGLYILDAMGGQTSGENFTFGAQQAYEVKNGKLGKMIRDINISGNLYSTLKNITHVGKDLVLSDAGGCGKGQINIRSCNGGPHIIVKNLIIGGK